MAIRRKPKIVNKYVCDTSETKRYMSAYRVIEQEPQICVHPSVVLDILMDEWRSEFKRKIHVARTERENRAIESIRDTMNQIIEKYKVHNGN